MALTKLIRLAHVDQHVRCLDRGVGIRDCDFLYVGPGQFDKVMCVLHPAFSLMLPKYSRCRSRAWWVVSGSSASSASYWLMKT